MRGWRKEEWKGWRNYTCGGDKTRNGEKKHDLEMRDTWLRERRMENMTKAFQGH